MIAYCPRCGWRGYVGDLVEIRVGYGFKSIWCCPSCSCEKVMVEEG